MFFDLTGYRGILLISAWCQGSVYDNRPVAERVFQLGSSGGSPEDARLIGLIEQSIATLDIFLSNHLPGSVTDSSMF